MYVNSASKHSQPPSLHPHSLSGMSTQYGEEGIVYKLAMIVLYGVVAVIAGAIGWVYAVTAYVCGVIWRPVSACFSFSSWVLSMVLLPLFLLGLASGFVGGVVGTLIAKIAYALSIVKRPTQETSIGVSNQPSDTESSEEELSEHLDDLNNLDTELRTPPELVGSGLEFYSRFRPSPALKTHDVGVEGFKLYEDDDGYVSSGPSSPIDASNSSFSRRQGTKPNRSFSTIYEETE